MKPPDNEKPFAQENAPEDKNQTAMAILEAADSLLTEVGYEGLSARAVSTKAGVNSALVFYYFGSKEALVERVLARYYQRHIDALEEAMSTQGTMRERMHALIDAYVTFIEENRRYPRLVQHQLAGPVEFRQHIQQNLAPLFQWTQKALEGLAPANGPQCAKHLFITISAAVVNYYTYAPVLEQEWGSDPMNAQALDERRAHLHWLVDAMLAQLEREQ